MSWPKNPLEKIEYRRREAREALLHLLINEKLDANLQKEIVKAVCDKSGRSFKELESLELLDPEQYSMLSLSLDILDYTSKQFSTTGLSSHNLSRNYLVRVVADNIIKFISVYDSVLDSYK